MWKRRLGLMLGLLAYLLAGHGALPTASFLSRHSPFAERFPCEDCACGCTSARDCWLNCCCHSVRERLAWAREHGVTPPAYAAEAIASETEDVGACALCCEKDPKAHGPSDARAPGRGAVMSALDCRGVSQWMAFAVPVSWGERSGELLPAPMPCGTIATGEMNAVRDGDLDVPTPPPRAA